MLISVSSCFVVSVELEENPTLAPRKTRKERERETVSERVRVCHKDVPLTN